MRLWTLGAFQAGKRRITFYKQYLHFINNIYTAIAEHQWDQQHQVEWDATRLLDRAARPVQLKVKEALHIEKTPANNRLNRDGGCELPGCWIATMKKLGGGGIRASINRAGTLTSAPSHIGARAQ